MAHIPVLLDSIMDVLGDIRGHKIIDCTFGAGGYTKRFLEAGATVVSFDRDTNAISIAQEIKSKYPDNFFFISDNFSNIDKATKYFDFFDEIVFDFGLSSMQIDNIERGFSYQKDAPLDMRMNQSSGETAEEFLNRIDEKTLCKIIKDYGDDQRAYFIAKKIIACRPLKTTQDLKHAIEIASYDPKSVARVFQAIRIYINDELNEIKIALKKTNDLLSVGGRLLTVSFHSGEDKIVKSYMNNLTEVKGDPRMPLTIENTPKYIKYIKNKISPSQSEINNNPRSRSAYFRVVKKIA